MSDAALRVVSLDLQTASDDVLEALNDHQNYMQAERLPDDPPRPLEMRRAGWCHMPAFVELHCWIVWDEDGRTVVANAWTEASKTEQNQHLLDFNILVLPAYRRRSLARRLLAAIADYSSTQNRRLLFAGTSSRIPAGELFMQRLGAKRGLETYTNQLALADLNVNLVQAWIGRAAKWASDFELGFWEGPYPQHDLLAIALLREVMNTAPRGELERDDIRMTPEYLRLDEQSLAARGVERWTAYVRERATGRLVGFSDVFWHPQFPILLEQGETGVLPDYRTRGFGRWLKAAMLEKVIRERSAVRFVRTGNADGNAPMLKINLELGFKPYTHDVWWQIELTQVQRYLAA